MAIQPPIDLKARAHQAMTDAGFQPDFSPAVINEINAIKSRPASRPDPAVRDLRPLLWSSIDNKSSRDLDQVEYVEQLDDGTHRLLVGIADVDSTVSKGSATDSHAAAEITSVYTGVVTYPMLPEDVSTQLTSLVQDADRLAIVIELVIAPSGEVGRHDVYQAWLRNRAKLDYPSTGAWLENRGPIPPVLSRVSGLEAQLRLQAETCRRLRGLRQRHGALTFASREVTPVIEQGVVRQLELDSRNVAEDMIESFMVAANVAMAEHLKEKNSLSLRRVVRTPKRWDRIQAIAAQFQVKLPDTPDQRPLSQFLEQRRTADPDHFPDLSLSIVKLLGPGEYLVERPGAASEGHFGLAVHDYTHSTAPNRRYADLITQRLLKAITSPGNHDYTEADLSQLAQHCTEREDAARKVERLMRKVSAACLLNSRIGEIFDGIITGASTKGTYVRLSKPPIEGRVTGGFHGIDVGDKVRVRLASVDVNKGFIDFEKV